MEVTYLAVVWFLSASTALIVSTWYVMSTFEKRLSTRISDIGK